jgi:hypothetical protein
MDRRINTTRRETITQQPSGSKRLESVGFNRAYMASTPLKSKVRQLCDVDLKRTRRSNKHYHYA